MSDHHHHQHDAVDPRILAAAREGCEEFQWLLNRRSMLGLAASFCAATMIPRSALSATTDRRLLIVILRGGMDGLHTIFPYTDQTFLDNRQLLYGDLESKKIILGSGMAAHPSLSNFAALVNRSGGAQGAVVHAIAPPFRQRSHFQCQYNLESGQDETNPTSSDGWLYRVLTKMAAVDQASFGGGLSDGQQLTGMLAVGNVPFILSGRPVDGAQNPPKVRSWSTAARSAGLPPSVATALLNYYNANDQGAFKRLQNAIAVDSKAGGTISGVNGIVAQFVGAGRLMSQDDGPRIGVISIENWDTHQNEGRISRNLQSLDDGIMKFQQEMQSVWNNTAVLCVSEFGRTIEVNGEDARGTEHGRGTVALLAGGTLRGKFVGTPANLRKDFNGDQNDPLMYGRHDVTPFLDLRSLFKSALYQHLGLPTTHDEFFFPNSATAPPLANVFRPA